MSQAMRRGIQHHKFCDCCGRALTIEESLTYIIEDGKKRYLCEWDRSFVSDAEANKQRANIVTWAINPEYSEYLGYPWV